MSSINVVFFDKKRRIFNFTLLQRVLCNCCKKMILHYYSEFYDVFLTKTKVVPLRFFSKCMFSLKIDVHKMDFKNHAF